MKIILKILLIVLACSCVWSFHFFQGNVSNGVVLANRTLIQMDPKPFSERVNTFFYPGQVNKIIQGIQAIDKLESTASAEVTSGGVGHIYVNMKFKSDEGAALDYDVAIYVMPGPTISYDV